jgi:hypothetical protein
MTGFPSLINNTLREVGQLPPVNKFACVMSPKSSINLIIIIPNKTNINKNCLFK